MMAQIKIGGELRPFQITPRVLSVWMSQTKKGLNDLANLNFEDLEVIFFHAFRSGHKKEHGTEPTWDLEIYRNWMDAPEAFKTLHQCQKELEASMQAMMGEETETSEQEEPGN